MSAAPSQSQMLSENTLQKIVTRYGLTEVKGADGGPYMSLQSHTPMAQGVIGNVRVFRGGPLFQVVTNALQVPAIGLDAHMIFAFMPADSAVPHFTVDSVCAGPHMAYHLDLIPRMDLGSRITYLNEVFQPLTEACQTGRAIEGLSLAQLAPRQWAIMSPWMQASRATPEAFAQIEGPVNQYLEHWFSLVDKGISPAALAGVSKQELIERDARSKAVIFNWDIDPVWKQIEPLIGTEQVQALIDLLKTPGI